MCAENKQILIQNFIVDMIVRGYRRILKVKYQVRSENKNLLWRILGLVLLATPCFRETEIKKGIKGKHSI